jgi:hypothetical protein
VAREVGAARSAGPLGWDGCPFLRRCGRRVAGSVLVIEARGSPTAMTLAGNGGRHLTDTDSVVFMCE